MSQRRNKLQKVVNRQGHATLAVSRMAACGSCRQESVSRMAQPGIDMLNTSVG
jgi:hypothetical protein